MRVSAYPVTGELPPPDSEPPDQEVGDRRPEEPEGHSPRERSMPSRGGVDQRPVLSEGDNMRPSSASSVNLGDTAVPESVSTDSMPVPCQPSPKAEQGIKTEPVPSQPSLNYKPEACSPPVPGDPSIDTTTRDGTPDGSPSVVRPQEMYVAFGEARRMAINDPECDKWLTTLAELFTIVHDSVKIDEKLVPPGKKRFPILRREE
uniref:Uncharacterized protein n=1 Tax=Peronospora matthiolae TaxID=2874970 RepID=A0AAV1TP20_9STRA